MTDHAVQASRGATLLSRVTRPKVIAPVLSALILTVGTVITQCPRRADVTEIAGTFLDENGSVLPGVDLSFVGVEEHQSTDSAGKFEFLLTKPPLGVLSLIARKDHYVHKNFNVAPSAPPTKYTLDHSSISGTVFGENELELSDCDVRIADGNQPYHTDSKGTFDIPTDNVPPEIKVEVIASHEGYERGTVFVNAPSHNVRIKLTRRLRPQPTPAPPPLAPIIVIGDAPKDLGVGKTFRQALAVEGGAPPFSWNGDLLQGPNQDLRFVSDKTDTRRAAIQGSPTVAGSYLFFVEVQDSHSSSARPIRVAVTVPALPEPPGIPPPTLPAGPPGPRSIEPTRPLIKVTVVAGASVPDVISDGDTPSKISASLKPTPFAQALEACLLASGYEESGANVPPALVQLRVARASEGFYLSWSATFPQQKPHDGFRVTLLQIDGAPYTPSSFVREICTYMQDHRPKVAR
jgi:hypothetical protein